MLQDKRIKSKGKTIFVSATPAQYEINVSESVVEQIIRPTGLLDPITYVYPKSGDSDILANSLDKLLKKKPHVEKFLDGYAEHVTKVDLKEVFENIGE
jgi:excinuclease ABC subunit B